MASLHSAVCLYSAVHVHDLACFFLSSFSSLIKTCMSVQCSIVASFTGISMQTQRNMQVKLLSEGKTWSETLREVDARRRGT